MLKVKHITSQEYVENSIFLHSEMYRVLLFSHKSVLTQTATVALLD